jgi:signal transduction histidine kinase
MIRPGEPPFPLEERSAAGLLLFLSLWTVIAVVAATTTFIALRGSTAQEWLTILGYMLYYFYVWAVISFAIHWLVRAGEKSGVPWFLQVPLHLVLLVAVAVALPFLIQPDDWRSWLYGERAIGFHSLNAFVYAFVLIGSMMVNYYRLSRWREADARAAQLRQMELEHSLDRSRFETLRAQINPHFLFNTLNSIASLVESSSNREAYKVIELLAALLRNALDFSRDDVVSLEEELEFLDAYLAIENVRFTDRLRVEKSIPCECLGYRVPALSLQPLLENVVKHAVSATSGPVSVQIDVSCLEGRLTIRISDDGPGFPNPIERGVGLDNVQNRLFYLYGESALFDLRNGPSGGASLTLAFPTQAAVGKDRSHRKEKPARRKNRAPGSGVLT